MQKVIISLIVAGCVVSISPWLANAVIWVKASEAVQGGAPVRLPDWSGYQVTTTLLGVGIIVAAIAMAIRNPPTDERGL